MKNTFKIAIFIILLTVSLSACKKDISLNPYNFTTTDQTNAAMLNNQIAGVYNVLEASELYGWGLWGYFAAGNDEGFNISAGGTTSQALTESFRSSSIDVSYLNLWKDLYQGVERANIILDVINQPVMDSTARARIKGQALFLRAYYFYLLVNNFGDVPYKNIPTSKMGTNFNLPETPSKAIYDSIIKDMSAADSLVANIFEVQTTTVVTKSAVEAILARVCITAAGYPVNGGVPYYTLANKWAIKLIKRNVHSLNNQSHPLYPSTPAYARVFINNMQNNFTDNNLSEGIWDAAFLSNGVGSYASLGYPVSQQLGAILGIPCGGLPKCTSVYRPYPTLYNLYAPGDTRRDWVMGNYKLDATGLTQLNNIVITSKYGFGVAANANVDPVTGTVLSISVTNGGIAYHSTPAADTPSINLTASFPLKGTNFSYHIVINSNGSITAINVINGGSGYLSIYDRTVAKWRRQYELNTIKNTAYTSSNFPIIRYADVLLMAAESDIQVNGGVASSAGIYYYNQVKRRAFGYDPLSVSPVDVSNLTMDSIKVERSRELCFEGVRRSDLKRWGLSGMINTISNVLSSVSNAPSTYSTSARLPSQNFLLNPKKYVLFPIPANELTLETGLSQNPGW
ncbi:RagB/SusD family nutrient uptake outer membrane protein [Parasediminibacterium sp. JCM 36343]|uniref:RagB/SusD family nutrient uptake outer membrane protein n=1 Tax=Parasediminibacterium sp. JCM 36343 TaxID=3374279 RepID=UPI0039790165